MDVWKDVSTRDASRCFIYLKVLVKTMQVRTAMRKEEVEEVIKAESVKDNVLNKLNVVQTLKMHLKNTGKGQKNGKRRREWKRTQRHCGKFSRRAAEAVGLSLASEKSFPKTWKSDVYDESGGCLLEVFVLFLCCLVSRI